MKITWIMLAVAVNTLWSAEPKPRKEPEFPTDVRVQRNVNYLAEGRKEQADLYFPKDMLPGKKYPAVVIIHGGGFSGGVRDAARELNIGGTLARNGYIGMSIDYLLCSSTKISWPQNLHDCKTAVRWLRKNAAQLQVDAEHIGVIGGSAGGHLAAMVALTEPKDGLEPSEPYSEFSSRVQCGVDLYGPNDLATWHDVSMFGKKRAEAPELYRQGSPITYARPGAPPMIIMHGTADTTVPVEQSKVLADALKKAGVETELIIIEGAPHTFHLQPKQRDLRPVVLGFFDKHLKK